MTKVEELETLIKTDIMVELDETIKELSIKEQKNKKEKELKEELKYLKEVQSYFKDLLIDIEKNIITQEDADEILDILEDMRVENQEV